jgi:hypothetical protein
MKELSQDSDLVDEVYYENVDLETGLQMLREGEGPKDNSVSNENKPKGTEVKEVIYVNQAALTKEEQLELFNYLKPYIEEQGAKTNKGTEASKMIGLGLRWDYKSNNPGKTPVDTGEIILPSSKTKYGYYNTSINNQPLAPITDRFRELMSKATGVDMANYDGAIINLYAKDTFIASHNDVDESVTAINYPVIGVNLGGKGNFSIEPRDGTPIQNLNLEAGTAYVFGVDGKNRKVYHRTFPTPQDSFLPELTTKIDGKTYPAGSYRVTITMRRIMPLTEGMPTAPELVTTTQPTEGPTTQPSDSKKIVDDLFTKVGGKKVSKGILQVDGQHWYMDLDYWTVAYKNGKDELFFYPDNDTEIYIGARPTGAKNFISDENIDTRSFTQIKKESSINNDMAEYAKLVEQNNGAQPKTFSVGNRTWTLNKFGNYDWSDPTSGQIYMRNVDMETGESIPETKMNEPVDPALIEQSLNYIDSNRKLLALDHKFADMGYDINDIIRDLIEAKTMQDYFNVKEKLDKLC